MGNRPAAAYTNYGTGRSLVRTMLARRQSVAAARRVPGREYAIDDALSRYSTQVPGGDPGPKRFFRSVFCRRENRCRNDGLRRQLQRVGRLLSLLAQLHF